MSGVASTDRSGGLPPLVAAAARGELPEWSDVSEPRRAHIQRVAALLSDWAGQLGLAAEERDRWAAVGWLHDSLREVPPETLLAEVPPEFRDYPGPLLHGPAAAERLSGVLDEEMLDAIRYHTIGHPRLGQVGRALYLADFLEPGRDFAREWRAELRGRMPAEMDRVLVDVLGARIRHLIEERRPIRPETAAFWSSLMGGPA